MIRTGLEVLIDEQLADLGRKRIGIVSHPAAVDHHYIDTATRLFKAGAMVTALYGPEHGYYGMVADGAPVDNATDKRTGLPVYSLYGRTKEPTPEMLARVDVIVFDMQDVGVRFYTFLSTLVYVMKGAAKAGKQVLVLDRPNPLNGLQREGPLVEPGFESFIGMLPIPMRHGLTLGELALYALKQQHIDCELSVIPVRGWQRNQWFDAMGRAWVPTSPGIPHFETTLPYVGTCLIEGTNLSEGRGTPLPFEVVGAPWVDGFALADLLNTRNLPGVIFRPCAFIPTASKHAARHCQGVQLHITDRDAFEAVRTGLHIVAACQELFRGDFHFLSSSWEGHPAHFDLLMGSSRPREQLTAGTAVEEITREWDDIPDKFDQLIQPFLIYR